MNMPYLESLNQQRVEAERHEAEERMRRFHIIVVTATLAGGIGIVIGMTLMAVLP